MSVVIAFEDLSPCRKQLTVEVPAPAVEAEAQRVVREYGRRVKLPGFRKGKAPASIIHSRFRDEIDREIVNRLVPRYWQQAQAEKSLDPILGPQIENVDLREGAALTFVATVEVRPEIELSDDRDFEYPETDPEPTEVEIDEVLERLRRQAAPWEIVDRTAAQGDRVSIELRESGEEPSSDDPQPLEIELGDDAVWEELRLAVTGLGAGQEADFSREEEPPPGSEGDTRRRSFHLKVHEVKEQQLPALDDDLAAKISDADSLDALREMIRDNVREQKASEARRQQEQALLDQLIDRNPFPLPEGVVGQEVDKVLHDYADNLARSGVDVEQAGLDWSGMAQQARPQAERRVRVRLLLDAVAEADEVDVEEEEFETMLAAIARAQKQSPLVVRQSLDKSGRLGELRRQMVRDKALKRLMGEEETLFSASENAGVESSGRENDQIDQSDEYHKSESDSTVSADQG